MELNEGIQLVGLARNSINSYFSDEIVETDKFNDIQGAFVVLHTIDGDLRGSMGFPKTDKKLGENIIRSARLAAFSDRRFRPIKKEEMDEIKVEVSVMTKPELLQFNPEEYKNNIKIGKDGLIIECDDFFGLLLPQVAKSLNLSQERFLDTVCGSAGLMPETWKEEKCKVYKFQVERFVEEEPGGKIIKDEN